ncbi:hypothetical protein Q0M69_14195, partial [Staphylococcus aureus]|nr:hypothetical protein [Staphylococcus aureus]
SLSLSVVVVAVGVVVTATIGTQIQRDSRVVGHTREVNWQMVAAASAEQRTTEPRNAILISNSVCFIVSCSSLPSH